MIEIKKLWKRRMVCLILMLCLGFAGVNPVYATKQEVEAAKQKATALEEEKKRVEESLKSLEGLKTSASAYVKKLDESLEGLNREMETLAGQINQKKEEIASAQLELEAAKETETEQYGAMKLRIKYMYERGNTSFVDLLLQSSNMAQLMNRAEYIRKISQYDRKKMDEYVATKEAIARHEANLEQEHTQLVELESQTKAKQQSVETLLGEKSKELKNFENQIQVAEGQIDEYEQDIKAQEGKVKQLEAEIRRQEEEARKAAAVAGKTYNTVSLGNIKFTWPLPSSGRITSGFGGRSSPTEGASTNHQGLDVGAPTGAPIVAAASGTVVISTYSYSSGNYIMLNHGGGVYSVYMHCSQLLVSEGQQVSQGQTIAKVGSTGYSTGPHLHFGIRAGGKYVNPALYVSP